MPPDPDRSVTPRLPVRVIPRLDIKGPNLVKGIHLEGLRVLGKPESFAESYYHDGADELIFQDVVASLYGRNSLQEIISRTARKIFIPLCVGGGLRSLEDIRQVLRAGADKVSINTAAVRRPELIDQASRRFGSSTIVVAIEAIRQQDGSWEAFTDNGRERSGRDALEWAREAADRGAGELLVTSVDREGTGDGYDLELIGGVVDRVGIPVIALGGAGARSHLVDAVSLGGADAVACASLFHYHAIGHLAETGTFDAPINLTAMRSRKAFGRVEPCSIPEAKAELASSGLDVRITSSPARDGAS